MIMVHQLSPFDSLRRLFDAEDLISRRRLILLLSSALGAFKQSKGVSFKKLLDSLFAPYFSKTSTQPFLPFMQAIFMRKFGGGGSSYMRYIYEVIFDRELQHS